MPFSIFKRKSLNDRYVDAGTKMGQRAARLAAYSSIDISEAAQRIGDVCGILRKPQQYAAYADIAALLLGEFEPIIAYFVIVEINEQFARPLGYAPFGQILLAIEHIDDSSGRTIVDTEWVRANPGAIAGPNRSPERTAKAAEILACALWNFPDIDTARKAFSVYSVTTVKEQVRERLRSHDEDVAKYITT
jgi:hypothetical protein